jgi:hypothetical protein
MALSFSVCLLTGSRAHAQPQPESEPGAQPSPAQPTAPELTPPPPPPGSIVDAPRSARLISVADEDEETAPASQLSLPQLYREQSRLDDVPGLVGPAVMLALGASGAALFGGVTFWIMSGNEWGKLIAAFLTGAVAVNALAVAIVGAALVGVRVRQRELMRERQQSIRERLAAITEGKAAEPTSNGEPTSRQQLELQLELIRLAEQRPGLGTPITLGVLGVVGMYIGFSSAGTSAIGLPVGLVGAGLFLTGAVLLVLNLKERASIDERVKALQAPETSSEDWLSSPLPPVAMPLPPAGRQPPPAPIYFAMAFPF